MIRQMKLSEEGMKTLETLSKLELSEIEKKELQIELQSILDCMDKLGELNTQEVRPLTHLDEIPIVFREDIVLREYTSKEILANAPSSHENTFVVPNTIQRGGQ